MTSKFPLSAGERRVVGALIEKGATTPDSYPLTTNSLRLACNQSTSRDPIVEYSEREVDALMLELRQRGLARTISGSGHRVSKHRHVVDDALGLNGAEVAVLAVMLLRGPQTVAELVSRTARYAGGPGDASDVDAAIDSLAGRDEPLAMRLSKRPGERELRVAQIWSPVDHLADHPTDPAGAPAALAPEPDSDLEPESAAESQAESQGESQAAIRSTVPHLYVLPDDASVVTSGGRPDDVSDGDSDDVSAVLSAGLPGDLEARVVALEAELANQTRRLDALIAELGD